MTIQLKNSFKLNEDPLNLLVTDNLEEYLVTSDQKHIWIFEIETFDLI